MKTERQPRGVVVASAVVLLASGIGLSLIRSTSGGPSSLVVYCAHDSVYSQQILDKFQRQTGVSVSIRFDTEATKSLGLVNLLIREKNHPRCDVFWNNQVLGTLDLQQQGVLLPYKGPGYERIPETFKDPDGHWAGFAGRMRVSIINTDALPADENLLKTKLAGDLSRMAIAKPLYGTTLSHYSLLWHLWGGEKLQAWHHDMRRRGVREVSGNATVKNLVAEGVCDFGWTDTDDFFVAQDDGKPVAMFPIRVDNDATILIPNSVAIIKGTNRLTKAQKLVDFLLSAETEIALARSNARQIPLGPVAIDDLPHDVQQLKQWAEDAHSLANLGPARSDCLAWLKKEYLR